MGLVYGTIVVNMLKYFMLLKVVRRKWYLSYTTNCDILPIINNTDSVELKKKKKCVKFIWSCLNSSNVAVKNVSLFLLSNKDSIIGNNFRYFSYKYKVYINNWFSL